MNSYKQSFYIGLIRIVANTIMFGAIFFGMYMASHSSLPAEASFCLWFLGITVPLWACSILLTRYIKRRFPAEAETLVTLPRRGPCLVRWRVLKPSKVFVLAR